MNEDYFLLNMNEIIFYFVLIILLDDLFILDTLI